MICTAPVRRTRAGEKSPETLLTPLVVKKAKKLSPKRKYVFGLWCRSKNVEHLPEGIPYKVSSDLELRSVGGTIVSGINKPLILVSDLLNRAERHCVARHELREWQRRREKSTEGHEAALKSDNPKLRKEIELNQKWFNQMILIMGAGEARFLTREDYLQWRDSPEVVKRHGKRKSWG